MVRRPENGKSVLSRRTDFCICHRVQAEPVALSGPHIEGTVSFIPGIERPILEVP